MVILLIAIYGFVCYYDCCSVIMMVVGLQWCGFYLCLFLYDVWMFRLVAVTVACL